MMRRNLSYPFLFALFLAGTCILAGCRKNVGVLTSVIYYEVTGYVLDSDSKAVVGAEVFLNGVTVTTTEATGKYVLSKMLPGSYLVSAKKIGYSQNAFDLTVSAAGASASSLTLKKLSTPVTVKPTLGATIIEKNTVTGATIATLAIAPNAVPGTADVQVSVTSLVGKEAPPLPDALTSGHVPGVTVSLGCSNPNITFPKGIALSFTLPFLHQPGTNLLVVTYNDATGKWESYSNAIVAPDGKTASLTIYHFSDWTLMVDAGFSTTSIAIAPVRVIYPSDGKIAWPATLDFPYGIAADFTPSFFVGFVTDQTGLVFSAYKNGTTTITIGTAQNILSITPHRNGNPEGFGHLSNLDWDLVKYSYNVQGKITVQVYDILLGSLVRKEIDCNFVMPSYAWIWKELRSIIYPARPYTGRLDEVSQIVLSLAHQGGEGN